MRSDKEERERLLFDSFLFRIRITIAQLHIQFQQMNEKKKHMGNETGPNRDADINRNRSEKKKAKERGKETKNRHMLHHYCEI